MDRNVLTKIVTDENIKIDVGKSTLDGVDHEYFISIVTFDKYSGLELEPEQHNVTPEWIKHEIDRFQKEIDRLNKLLEIVTAKEIPVIQAKVTAKPIENSEIPVPDA